MIKTKKTYELAIKQSRELLEQIKEYEEKESKKFKYWRISHDADTNETGLLMNRTYIKTIWQGFDAQQGAELEIIEDFCFSRFGCKTAYVQGIAACVNWKVAQIERDEFYQASPVIWGGIKTKTMRLTLEIGNREEINILSEEEV